MFLLLQGKNRESPGPNNLPDELLVERYLETGNKDLIAILFERYTHLLYGICLKYLQDPDQCKDAVMDIFESLFDKLTVHKVLNFRNWLYSVARNHCLMVIRKSGSLAKARNGFHAEAEHAEMPGENPDEDDLLNNKVLVNSALDKLNQEQSACIKLMYLEEKSYRDISDITGYTINEVKSHIQNGRRNLKNFLSKQHGNQAI